MLDEIKDRISLCIHELKKYGPTTLILIVGGLIVWDITDNHLFAFVVFFGLIVGCIGAFAALCALLCGTSGSANDDDDTVKTKPKRYAAFSIDGRQLTLPCDYEVQAREAFSSNGTDAWEIRKVY